MKLGARLNALVAMIPLGSRIADVGTDHAYLPMYLIMSGQIEAAVAIDVHTGPFRSACDAVQRAGLADKISVRLGDGLSVVTPGEADVAVMAGMGGPTMISIMEQSLPVVSSLNRMVLQPMVATPLVRRWLVDNNWTISDEAIVEEDGRLYEIIAAEPGKMECLEPDLLEIGPILWEKRHPLLVKLIHQRLNMLYSISSQLENSTASQTMTKYQENKTLISLLEVKLSCL